MILVIFIYGITVSVRIFTDWWLSEWLNSNANVIKINAGFTEFYDIASNLG